MTVMQPVWPARCEADNHAMLRYLEVRLFEIESKKLVTWHKDARVPHTDAERLDYAIKYAEAGDVRELRNELLRRIEDPRIGRFINLPKLANKKGEHWSKPTDTWIGKAAAAVPTIRKLLRDYKGKQWQKGDGWSAEQFAAEIYNVHADQIARHIKHGRRRD